MTEQQFLLRQPTYPAKQPYDDYYFRFANRLEKVIEDRRLLTKWPAEFRNRVALALTGYLQDTMTDSGIWRAFISHHHQLYGRWIPFYDVPEDYVPHELNEVDVRFLIWYTLALNSNGPQRFCNPLDEDIRKAAEILHTELDLVYDDENAPIPEGYNLSAELELGNPEEADAVFHLGHWLFMHCWLMTPAYAMTLSEILANPKLEGGRNTDALRKALEASMMEDPTGPLALYIREWLFLIIEDRMPPMGKAEKEHLKRLEEAGDHPYYTKFMAATDGKPIIFFKTYKELNNFFISALGWDNTDNLPALKESSDFVLLVNKHKGMLCARNVARCIKLEENPCYDPEYAREHAFELLTIRGLCPGDLLQYIFEHDALSDARFPGSEDTKLVNENQDFIARCYLQKYYRGD